MEVVLEGPLGAVEDFKDGEMCVRILLLCGSFSGV